MPATAEPPPVTAPAPTMGEKFSAELNRLQKQTPPPPSSTEPDKTAPEPPVEKAPEKPVAKKAEAAKAAPQSALDAVLGGEPDAKVPVEEPVVDDPLKEFSEKDANWKKARELIGKQHEELKELRSKVGKREPDPAILSELQTVKQTLAQREAALAEKEAKLAEYNDAMTAVNLELHPDYRREFIEGRKELVNSAANKLKSYGGNPDLLAEALELPEGRRRDAAVEEALGDLTDSAKAKILKTVADVETLDERRAKALANAQPEYEQLERKTIAQRQKQAEEAERIKAVEFERVTRDLHKSAPMLGPVDESIADGKDWNAGLKEDIANGYKLFSPDASFDELAATAVLGKRYHRVVPMLASKVTEQSKEIAALKTQLAEFDGAQPEFRGTKKPSTADAENMTPGQKWTAAMAKLTEQQDV